MAPSDAKGIHVALVMGFARERRPSCDRGRLLDSPQPDECHTARVVRPNACGARAGSRPYWAERRAVASPLTRAPRCAGCRRPARDRAR
jgi:hypothetical protein